MNEYYKDSSSTTPLRQSLNEVENAIKCTKTRGPSIDLKISLLLLLKRYADGFKFVDSLEEDDFNPRYKKKVMAENFRALDFEQRHDTVSRNRLFKEIITNIRNYIQGDNGGKDTLNEEAYLYLYTFKEKLFGPNKTDAEIDSLQFQFPQKKDYLKLIKNAIKETPIEDSTAATPDK